MPRPHLRERGGAAQACSTRMREHRVTLATFELRTSLSNYTFHGPSIHPCSNTTTAGHESPSARCDVRLAFGPPMGALIHTPPKA